MLTAPSGTSDTFSRETDWPSWWRRGPRPLARGRASLFSRRSWFSSGPAGRGQGVVLRVVDADRLVETGQLKDLAVVVGQAVGEHPLALALGAHEQRDEQTDATAVHVVETGEVEHYRAHPVPARAAVGVHQHVFALGGDVALDVDYAD